MTTHAPHGTRGDDNNAMSSTIWEIAKYGTGFLCVVVFFLGIGYATHQKSETVVTAQQLPQHFNCPAAADGKQVCEFDDKGYLLDVGSGTKFLCVYPLSDVGKYRVDFDSGGSKESPDVKSGSNLYTAPKGER